MQLWNFIKPFINLSTCTKCFIIFMLLITIKSSLFKVEKGKRQLGLSVRASLNQNLSMITVCLKTWGNVYFRSVYQVKKTLWNPCCTYIQCSYFMGLLAVIFIKASYSCLNQHDYYKIFPDLGQTAYLESFVSIFRGRHWTVLWIIGNLHDGKNL